MIEINLKDKSISKNKIDIHLKETSYLLADFFNGIVIEFEEEYLYEKQ